MSVETHRVLMGTCGWNHDAWLDNFYSEDLPEDWRLGFYSNEFPVVYVAAKQWLDREDIAEWSEEVAESFRFILEISAEVLDDQQRFSRAIEKAKILNEFCLGLVFQLNPNICNDTNRFEERLKLAQSLAPVCVDSNNIALTKEFTEILAKYDVAEVWDGNPDVTKYIPRGSLAISHISADNLDMKSLRKIIEHCLTVSNEDCVSVLCLDGNPPSLELLRKADIILNLL